MAATGRQPAELPSLLANRGFTSGLALGLAFFGIALLCLALVWLLPRSAPAEQPGEH